MSDAGYDELLVLQECLADQPDQFVTQSRIVKPYKEFFIKVYKIYAAHCKTLKITNETTIIGKFLE
jgi:hypothetical protein